MSCLLTGVRCRRVNEDSILAIQIFDQKKFKKKDQGFLGVINVRIGDVIDLQMGGDGKLRCLPRSDCLELGRAQKLIMLRALLQRCSLATSKNQTTTSSSMVN